MGTLGALPQAVGSTSDQAVSHYIPYNLTVGSSTLKSLGVDPSFYSFSALSYLTPNVTPVKIIVGENLVFNDTAWKPYYIKVDVPRGNYSLILMNVSVKEVNGTQFDRPLYVFVDGVPVFWGSTQEIENSTAAVDLTTFENLLEGNVTFEPVLVNFYSAKDNVTGVYLMNVTLTLYPGAEPPGLPNGFIPLFVNGTFNYNYSYVILTPTMDSITTHFTVPKGTYRMTALLYEEGGGLDEFWYSNEPATRDILLYYNGLLGSVIPPYETIYTGGIDLFWWKPLTSINTLAFHTPYQVDLTPFLALGNHANVTVTMSNLKTAEQINHSPAFDWDLSGVILLWVNQSNVLLGGQLNVAYSRFVDSTPLFAGGFSGVHYQEGGNYLLEYSSTLHFSDGIEVATVVQSGRFSSYQSFNSIYELAYLDESFHEVSTESGVYNSSMTVQGNFPITLQLSAFLTPISSPSVIPFNLSYAQNGTLSLGVDYAYNFTFNGFRTSQTVNENASAEGGFSGVIEVINSYGGAILVKLTSNNAVTQKDLNFLFLSGQLSSLKGFHESFYAEAVQNSTVNTTGYYVKLQVRLSPINSTNSGGQTESTIYQSSVRQGNLQESRYRLALYPPLYPLSYLQIHVRSFPF
ncbi:glycopeptidase [Metallosphaera tengchongensis]|uniref:Glycopeptidase n=2 Tax=Metallosphaera tengchongensis TaxID=1532350 RepID=A0A6N0NYM9_9CREN|nr:glycopeptidase [Metallosphaera tengchongensis]